MEISETKSHLSVDQKSIASQHSGSHSQGLLPNSKDNVKVVIRIRPLNEREKSTFLVQCVDHGGSKKCITLENSNTITIEQKPDTKTFNFDFVGDEELEQETVFNQIAKPIAESCLEGYNGTIFAYGQTGAGKTFTIQGPGIAGPNGEELMLGITEGDNSKVGLMPRSFNYIFESLEKANEKASNSSDGSHFSFIVRCSYLEIYNEQIMDLMDPSSVNLHIREDLKKGVYVEGLIEENVTSAQEMLEIIYRGARNRHVGCTSMNKESSRSHSVLTTIIETKSMKEGGVWNIKSSRFHIIDLAGSERQKYTGAVGERLKEAGMINKSLSALGNVINSLVDISEGKNRHVHYRDSKLTFLLRDSLGGNSKTLIIANISPSAVNYGETLSTLKFAQRAKLIKNKAVINEDSSGTLQLLRNEINRLKKALAESEKTAQNLGQQCAFCRNNIGGEISGQSVLFDDDEDLLSESFSGLVDDFDPRALEHSLPGPNILSEAVKTKFRSQKQDLFKLRERVVYLEGLLSANLDNLTSQQKFYDQEVQKLQQQNKKLQQAVDSAEKQCSRDKMLIKFRNDRITKLEAGQKATTEDEKDQVIEELKKEIQVWNSSKEHNAQAAKLFADKAELNLQLEQLKKEVKQTPDSLGAQMRSMNELNESLNNYLKQFCEQSKKNVEGELAKTKQDYQENLDKLSEALAEQSRQQEATQDKFHQEQLRWESMLNEQKDLCEQLKETFTTEKEELEKIHSEKIQSIKNEIEEISENKSEQEKEAQLLKIQLHEKEKELEKTQAKILQLTQENASKDQQHLELTLKSEDQSKQFESSLKEQQEKLKQEQTQWERKLEQQKNNLESQMGEQSETFEKKLFELEKKVMEGQNEREVLTDQCDQLTLRINQLAEENDTVQKTLLYKEEELKEGKQQLAQKETEAQALLEKIQKVQEETGLEKEKKERLIEELREKQGELEKEIEVLGKRVQLLEEENQELRDSLLELKKEIKDMETERTGLEQEMKEKERLLKDEFQKEKKAVESYQEQLSNKDEKIKELENALDQENERFVMVKDSLRSEIEEIQKLKKDLQTRHEEAFKEKEHLLLQNESLTKDIEKQKNEIDQLQSKACQEQILAAEERAELDKLIQSLRQEIQEERGKMTVLEQQIQQSSMTNQGTQELLSEKNTEIGQLQKRLAEAIQEGESKVKQLEQQQQEVEREYQGKISELKSQGFKSQESFEKKLADVTLTHEQEKKSLQHSQGEEVSKLRQINEELERKHSQRVEELEKIQSQKVQEVEKKEEEHTKKVAQCQKDLEEARIHFHKINEDLKSQVEDLQNTIAEEKLNYDQEKVKEKEKKTQLEEKIESQSEQIDQQREEIEGLVALKDQEKGQIVSDMEKSIEDLQNYLIEIKQQSSHKEIEFQEQVKILTETKEQFSEELKNKESEIQELAGQLSSSKHLLSQQKSDLVQSYQQQLSEKEAIIEGAREQLGQYEEKQKAQKQSFEKQVALLGEKQEKLKAEWEEKEAALRDVINNQERDMKFLKEHVSNSSQDKQKMLSELQVLKSNEASFRRQAEEDKQTVAKLEGQLKCQQSQLESSLEQLSSTHAKASQQMEVRHEEVQRQLSSELEEWKGQVQRLQGKCDEQKEMLKSSKETISGMVAKENELIIQVETKINELKEHQEGWRRRAQEAKDEKENVKKEWERARKENENLRELIKLKDRQIEEQQNVDEKDREVIEKIQKENKDLRNQLIKREFEMKEVVKTIKLFQDEKSRLEKELDKLHRENDQLVGHKNPSQKIQHHLKIKEENNKLREENFKFQQELRRKNELLSSKGIQSSALGKPSDEDQPHQREDVKKLKNENLTYQETINRLVDHILSQPGLMKFIGLSEEVQEKIQSQSGTGKVKNAMEIVSLLANMALSKEKEIKELGREKKNMEHRLDIIEKEKNLCKQQLDILHSSSPSQQQKISQGSYITKSPTANRLIDPSLLPNDLVIGGQESDPLGRNNGWGRLQVEGFLSNEKPNYHQMNSQIPSASPFLQKFRQMKEKENLQAKKEVVHQRSSSGRRAYLSGNPK